MSRFLNCWCFVFHQSSDDARLYDTDDLLTVTWNIRLNLPGKIMLMLNLGPI